MNQFIERGVTTSIKKSLSYFPVTAILGPRQCGKSTLARKLIHEAGEYILLDMERPADIAKLDNAEFFLSQHSDKLVCIDEIQRVPELFPLLRYLIDSNRRPGRFLILGSASQDLIQQSSETLAGRIAYHELTPFVHDEIKEIVTLEDHWLKGGFPNSVLINDNEISIDWRRNFASTFLERDLQQFNSMVSPVTMRRFWSMLSHYHGQVMNYSKLGQSLDVTHTTIKRWLDIFEQTFMVRVLRPYEGNLKKRLVKSPKVYLRDSGVLHYFLDLDNIDQVLGHPACGSSWEGYAIENILTHFPRFKSSYYRTSNGEEIDLILEYKQKKVGVEFKLSSSTKLGRSVENSIELLELEQLFVVTPEEQNIKVAPKITHCCLNNIVESINTYLL